MTDTDILAFVKARIAEDEQTARDAEADLRGTTWQSFADALWKRTDHVDSICDHVERHDPSRVLREVAAKRLLLEEHGHYISSGYNGVEAFDVIRCIVCHDDDEDAGVVYPCLTVRALAGIWTAHPDYNPSWTVE